VGFFFCLFSRKGTRNPAQRSGINSIGIVSAGESPDNPFDGKAMTLCPPASQDPPLYAIPLEFSSATGTCGSVLDGKNNPKNILENIWPVQKKVVSLHYQKRNKKTLTN
jgi:hypothetical protein